MIQDEIIEANRKSALEQVKQDERNEVLKAGMQAGVLMNSQPYHAYTFIGEHDEQYEALQDIHRENVESSRNN